ncbi:MAG: DUF1232 domain-containing protein [Bacteroidales bacterium]|nr:DUF1232 domain-containing protein [Bacteroidales bacterium]
MAEQKFDGQQMLIGYDKNYSEKGFWDKLKDVALKAGQKVIYYALLLYYTATSNSTPTEAKILIYSAIGYFILPMDLVPDWIPAVGFTDDAAALFACYRTVASHVTKDIEKMAESKLSEWFGKVDHNELKGYLNSK